MEREKFELFDVLLKSSKIEPKIGSSILAIENKELFLICDALNIPFSVLKTLPNLRDIISNHVIVRMGKDFVEVLSGKKLTFEETGSERLVDGVEISCPSKHVFNGSQSRQN